MTIDNFFKDCESLAEKYEKHLLDVIIEYTRIELDFRKQMIDLSHEDILRLTGQHYQKLSDERYDKQIIF